LLISSNSWLVAGHPRGLEGAVEIG